MENFQTQIRTKPAPKEKENTWTENELINPDEVVEFFYEKGQGGNANGAPSNVIREYETLDSCAKKRFNNRTNTWTYFVKKHRYDFIDPYDSISFNRRNKNKQDENYDPAAIGSYRFVKVSETVFNLYCKYLSTGRNVFKIKAERERG